MLTFLEKSNTNLSSAIISGVAGVAMAQEIVENYLLGFFNATYPTKTPSGISPVDMSTFLLKVRVIRRREVLSYPCSNIVNKLYGSRVRLPCNVQS